MVGATLVTSTTCTDSESVPLAPSESATFIFTFAVVGPSGKEQSKLPPVAVASYEPDTSVPLSVAAASQSGKPGDAAKVSSPGSATAKEYVCVDPSLTAAAPVTLTVGATLATVTVWLSSAPVSPSESVADADTVELFGPSGNRQSNEPELFVLLSEPTSTPLPPHDVCTDWTVSSPGSEIE